MFRGEFDGVAQKVVEDLFHPNAICVKFYAGKGLLLDLDLLGGGERPLQIVDALRHSPCRLALSLSSDEVSRDPRQLIDA